MELSAKYNPSEVEDKWYKYWTDQNLFASRPDGREPYTVVIPPPNVTGVLHMGHMLNNTIQDILVRRARMLGKNACWVPGTDHASIATEARVVAKLRNEGIDKASLTRDEFLAHAWEWKEKHGGIILEQLKKLGASCDWSRTRFTMDEDYSASVIKVFADLYRKGLIYRGVRMVNWDPQARTAVSDEEVNYKEVNSKLYHLRYFIADSKEYVVVATTRPETILGDTAVCVHPEDERYLHLHGQKVLVPLINRAVPVIADEYVDREFGTGVLKVTPAHDVNDYMLGQKYALETIDIFNDNGTLNEKAKLYVGEDRFAVRKKIVEDLSAAGHIEKIEDYVNKLGYSERTDAVIEPKLSMQWFLSMKDISIPALENVLKDTIQLHPAKFKNTYRHWMENVKDWCISRQLWWGHRIPAWYLPGSNDFVVAETADEALVLARAKTGNQQLTIAELHQDEDVLDTWFSSWLWPISVFDGLIRPDNEDINYYYPTNDLVTAPEILFFWVARMIIAGYEYKGDKPFKNVYLTGIVRDKLGRKMSKSLGNSPDPIELMQKYSADGVRIGMLLCSPAGNDLPFDESLTEQGRNFGNKIWNAFRLVKGWEVSDTAAQPEHARQAVEWFGQKLNESMAAIDKLFADFAISEALMMVYKLFWDDFSAWYLEMVKPDYQKPIDKISYQATLEYFDRLMRVLHPFMPFISEEIWQNISDRKHGESIMVASMPKVGSFDQRMLAQFDAAREIVSAIRTIRQEKGLSPREPLTLLVRDSNSPNAFMPVVMRLACISTIEHVTGQADGAVSFRVGTNEYYLPMENLIDVEDELAKLDKELVYYQGFLKSVEGKLSNKKFVDNAPKPVVDSELKKKEDALTKIALLESQIAALRSK